MPEARPALHQGGLGEVVKAQRSEGCRRYSSLRHVWSPCVALCQTNARVQRAIGEVDEQIHRHEACGEDQYSRLDHRIVAPHDGLIEGEANSWPGKNGLDHHCTSQETRKLQTCYCYRRNQSISEGVLVDHPAFGES